MDNFDDFFSPDIFHNLLFYYGINDFFKLYPKAVVQSQALAQAVADEKLNWMELCREVSRA